MQFYCCSMDRNVNFKHKSEETTEETLLLFIDILMIELKQTVNKRELETRTILVYEKS